MQVWLMSLDKWQKLGLCHQTLHRKHSNGMTNDLRLYWILANVNRTLMYQTQKIQTNDWKKLILWNPDKIAQKSEFQRFIDFNNPWNRRMQNSNLVRISELNRKRVALMARVNTKIKKRCHAEKLRGCPKNVFS